VIRVLDFAAAVVPAKRKVRVTEPRAAAAVRIAKTGGVAAAGLGAASRRSQYAAAPKSITARSKKNGHRRFGCGGVEAGSTNRGPTTGWLARVGATEPLGTAEVLPILLIWYSILRIYLYIMTEKVLPWLCSAAKFQHREW